MRSTGLPENDPAILVGMGRYRVVNHSTRLACVGLGSCVALVLHDPLKEIGAIAHVMLPSHEGPKSRPNPGKFADLSLEAMTKEMERLGASRHRFKAKLFGGANMFPLIESGMGDSIGDRNVRALKEGLKKWKIEITAEDVGGHVGRTIVFNSRNGEVQVRYAGGSEKTY